MYNNLYNNIDSVFISFIYIINDIEERDKHTLLYKVLYK